MSVSLLECYVKWKFYTKMSEHRIVYDDWERKEIIPIYLQYFFYSSKVSEANAQLQSVVLTMCHELNRELSYYIMNAAWVLSKYVTLFPCSLFYCDSESMHHHYVHCQLTLGALTAIKLQVTRAMFLWREFGKSWNLKKNYVKNFDVNFPFYNKY